MSILKYKGFHGEAKYEDGTIIIKLLHIEDTILSNCDDAKDVNRCFEELVEDYLETCNVLGKSPCKPFSGTFNVRVSPHIHKQASISAAQAEKSLNSWIEEAIQKKIQLEERKVDYVYRYISHKESLVKSRPQRPILSENDYENLEQGTEFNEIGMSPSRPTLSFSHRQRVN